MAGILQSVDSLAAKFVAAQSRLDGRQRRLFVGAESRALGRPLISTNWRGRPQTSHEVIVNTIAHTTTRTGLSVDTELDDQIYPKASRSPTR